MPQNTIEKQLMERIITNATTEAHRFVGVPKNIIWNKAEEAAEQFVSGHGLEELEKEGAKEQYKEIFVEAIMNII